METKGMLQNSVTYKGKVKIKYKRNNKVYELDNHNTGTKFLGIFTTATLPSSPAAGNYAIELGTDDKFCFCTSAGTWKKAIYMGLYTTAPAASGNSGKVIGLLSGGTVTYKYCNGSSWSNLSNNIFYHLSMQTIDG